MSIRTFVGTLFVMIVFLVGSAQGKSLRERDSLITIGINQIYGIKFDSARITFGKVLRKYPDDPAGKFFDAMILWWQIMLDLENESYDKEFIRKLTETVEFCDEILGKNPTDTRAMFFKGGALGFRGRLYSIRKEFFKAALDAKDALPYIGKIHKLDPKNIDVILGFGIYNFYAVAIPEKYPFIKPFMVFFPGGNKEKGLRQLREVAYHGNFAKIEANYFLLQVYYSFEKNVDSAFAYAKRLFSWFPNNPVFNAYYGRTFARRGDWRKTAEVFRGVYNKCKRNFPGYNEKVLREAAYYIGNWFKIEGKMDSAIVYLRISQLLSEKLDVKKQTGFLANSLLYLGMAYDALGYRDLAVQKYKETLKVKDFHNSHSLAKKYLRHPYKFPK